MQTNSKLMSFFISLGFKSFAWPFRRLHCPVESSALVLEVGSGGNPYFRTNVCCDAYFETQERHFVPLIADRPTVLAFAENLPFKDHAFDFVIASHVLEHSTDPEKFISELQRVAKAGYIEVPDAFFERICAYPDHRLEITDKDGTLFIQKKKAPCSDPHLIDLYRNKVSSIYPKFIAMAPFEHHVRYFWSNETGGIKYKILNPEYQFDWSADAINPNIQHSLKARVKASILETIRNVLSQTKRNKNISLLKLMRCYKCRGIDLVENGKIIKCNSCDHKHEFLKPMLLKC